MNYERATVLPEKKIYNILDRHRYHELDGLRGIAAIAVGLFHCMTAIFLLDYTMPGRLVIVAISSTINGKTAVDLFFVMSGFFLAGMLEKVNLKTLPKFYLRRLVRLAPPAMMSVIILYIYAKTILGYYPTYPLQPKFPLYYAACRDISLRELFLDLLLVHHNLNFVLWTIRTEILASLIFPFLFFLKNYRKSFSYKLSIFIFLFLLALSLNNYQKAGLDVFQYLYIFYAGSLIRDYSGRVAKLTQLQQYALFFASAALVLCAGFINLAGQSLIDLFNLTVAVFGACLAAMLAFGAIAGPQNFMRSTIVQFFGRISYSYYLVNWVFVLSFANLALYFHMPSHFGPLLSILFISITSTIFCIPGAYLFHLAFEQPSVALSRYIGRNPA